LPGRISAPVIGRDGVTTIAGKIDLEALVSVFDTIRIVRTKLPPEVTLLGFCGAPWTVATYMVAGCGTETQPARRRQAFTALDAQLQLWHR
jgi:uroporphyrinogen decarboxylase